MPNHPIINFLGIKDPCIEFHNLEERAEGFYVDLTTKKRAVTCRLCQEKTNKLHAYRWQKISSQMVQGKTVTIHLKKRRYQCRACRHSFFEKLSFVEKYQRRTVALNQQALSYVGNLSFTEAAKLSGLSVSTLLRSFDKRTIRVRRQLPRAIAIDEFKGDAGGERFQTIIVDVDKHEIIEILPDRRVDTIEKYFRSCETSRVDLVVMDMSASFKRAVKNVFDNPVIIADRFHFMRQAYWALDGVRREVQKTYTKVERLRSKRLKKLLWKAPEKLSDKGKAKLETVLEASPYLTQAYNLKNALHQWFKTSNAKTAKEGLKDWYQLVEKTNCPLFKKVVKTFKRWQQEILSAFAFPYNNGFIEGVNNTTKVIKRQSYGIKSFKRLRKKILFRQAIKSLNR